MKNTHTDKEINKFLNDLIGAKQIEDDVEFEHMLSPLQTYHKIKEFFEINAHK